MIQNRIYSIRKMNIQHAESTPPYISTFIQNNMKKLIEIYNDGMNNFHEGCLGFQCSQKENKMDVQFMNDESMLTILQKESWETLKNSISEDKKLFFVMDVDMNSVFLIYV